MKRFIVNKLLIARIESELYTIYWKFEMFVDDIIGCGRNWKHKFRKFSSFGVQYSLEFARLPHFLPKARSENVLREKKFN